ncbi:nitrate- and nitrite sensing domain-containing protein [Streptomyces chitinivorans]|uniref:histidine kinase n=1 Tax=Streptomyces chitinivorans TaxID=1257027 RepID=A0ABW7HXS5_9ACTN|nr:nitrate- and nitrite sensing domain-containing protein [Streptomyces chitinivorans]MDH2409563.1 nitrate- and nitrite sensing domain-containing protein [Streptomyces chitinivorans]
MRRSNPSSPPGEPRGNFTPPQRAVEAHSDLPGNGGESGSGGRFAVRNWRVATRLNAILLIPVLVALVFGGFRVQNSLETLNEAEDANRTAELVRAAAAYGHALIDERDRTAAPLLQGKTEDPVIAEVRGVTDAAREEFDRRVEQMPDQQNLKRRLAAFRQVEPELEELRQAAYTDRLKGVETEEGYVRVQHPLMEFANELGLGTGNITSYGRTVYAISLSKAAESLQRSIGTHLLIKPGPGAADKQRQLTAFSSYAYLENIAVEEYRGGSSPEDWELLQEEKAKADEEARERLAEAEEEAEAAGRDFATPPATDKMIQAIASGTSPQKLRAGGVTAENWYTAATANFNAYREVEKNLTDRAVNETAQIASDAKRDAIVNSVIVFAALVVAFVIAGMMARSMSNNMRRLRTAAFDVAQQRLPMLVDQLSRTDPGKVDTRVQPIPINSRDEIGEVARAFDQVHREAVRLAAEQALLRGNVNAIFTNLSRRNQGLIEGQLALITDLENNEADPDQLENLFKLDHLATRMRRNGENLLVLAGEEPGRRWTQPVPLVDVLRAASSEVEDYERIELSGVPESEIHGAVVTDLVHLLAELLENATSFSSPQTKVKVTATRLPDGRVMIEIHDKGIGLTPEDFADINHKLANPPTVDAAISQRMGLFVVGRLSSRHGIRVQLRPSGEQAGTTSLVMLPEEITHGGGGQEEVEEDFTVSRIVPEQPNAAQPAPQNRQLSAADLGFDDSRYGSQAEEQENSPQLDPLGRSLMREERRAALESQQPQQPRYQQQEGGYGGYGDENNTHAQEQYAPQAPQQASYGQQAPYDPGQTGQYGSQAGFPEGAGYGQETGYGQGYQDGYQSQYQQSQQQGGGYDGGYGDGFGRQHQGEYRPDYGTGYGENGYDAGQEPVRNTEAESFPSAPEDGPERVGFDRPGQDSDASTTVTGAGLPRREPRGQQSDEGSAPRYQPQAESPEVPRQADRSDDSGWRTANDERWQRAEGLRDPKAGGVTPSGLPRRVPKANLVEGTAEQTPQDGAQVSRNPEDVRGRLSNLHRGVRRGRTAGGSDNTQNDRPGFGPGSTYDQER